MGGDDRYAQLVKALLGDHRERSITGEYRRSHFEDYLDRCAKFGIDYPRIWNRISTLFDGRIPAIQEYACHDEPLKELLYALFASEVPEQLGAAGVQKLLADLVRDAWAMWGFHAHGRSTFLMRRDLTRMLLETDLSVDWAALQLPFKFFYLRFEDAPIEIVNEDGTHYPLDGCYVTEMERRAAETSVAEILGGKLAADMKWLPGPWLHFLFVSKPSPEIVGGANTQFLYCVRGQPTDALDEAYLRREYDSVIVRNGRVASFTEIAQLMKLAINSILYINSIGDAVDRVSNAERRARLAQVTERTVPRRERDRIQNEERSGTMLDYFDVGRNVVLSNYAHDPGEWRMGGGVRQFRYRHVVRGYWRRQHHGPKNSLVKTVWVAPCWRGQNAVQALARIYDVRGKESV